MRRITIEEPLVWSAAWSRTFAIFSVVVAAVGVIMARKGAEPTAAVAVEASAVLIALLAVLLAMIAMVVIWRTGYRGMGRLLAGLVIAAFVLAYPAYLMVSSHGRAPLDDASTDLDDPPRFSLGAHAIAARGSGAPEAPSHADLDTQRRFYPDLQPVLLDSDSSDTYQTILKLVTARHWRIVSERIPLSETDIGGIEAVAGSTLMGFPVDIVIRIRPQEGQTRVDIRSVSRSKWHAPDSDPRRVQALADDIDEQTGDDDDD